MNKLLAKLLTCLIFDRDKRRLRRDNLINNVYDYNKIKLIMTLVVKDEENIIEKNIRFHHAMGVDGFIVVNHNSTDSTLDILQRLQSEGLVLEIHTKTTVKHEHSKWVNEMVNIARNKYNANWVINADADEFYYSNSLNLKKSIASVPKANVLWVDSMMSMPDDSAEFTNYFIVRGMREYDAKKFDLDITDDYILYKFPFGDKRCTKVIHKTKGFISVTDGNHDVEIKNPIKIQSADIRLYHYHCRSLKAYEMKAKRWLASVDLTFTHGTVYMHRLRDAYLNGTVPELYSDIYGDKHRQFLIDEGIVVIDKSVNNFMEYKKI